MKKIINFLIVAVTFSTITVSCTKDDEGINGDANQATANASYLSLNNRILAAFVINQSTLPNVAAGLLPVNGTYNKLRKQLTYDTISAANKATIYNVGDTITLLTYVRGDDSAIAKRSLSYKFFGVPTLYPGGRPADNWVKPISNPQVSFIQSAEDSVRNFAPRSIDVLNTVNFSAITVTNTFPLEVTKVASEKLSGINYNTYLVKLNYIIPIALSTKLVSINFSVSAGTLRNDVGNVNWNYAFRVR